ncbi:helix-turn-helix domain-containing protein [Streptomyces paludis]|uniref:Helix-turn-helix domain-containing protein n=1 Tax=Streptomyces paludis TaxID=2282738 RepID=A0A345HNP7_9ACTN|nr:helix-turn-helix domain-containing protein [Streptomyces paludis]
MAKVHLPQDPGYTIVGNHLAQHVELSFTAIGLGTHIQSLPVGAPVDIRTLSARHPEGRERIAAALRELEAHGYIERRRERTDDGRIVSLTISYNNPEAARARLALEAALPTEPPPLQVQPEAAPEAVREEAPEAVREAPPETVEVRPEPVPAAEAPPEASPAPPPPLPDAEAHDPDRRRAAADLLAGLRRDDPRLLLPERDVRRLAPGVEAWLERGATPYAVHHALTAALPLNLRHPAALLAHRLTALLPPPLPPALALQAAPVGAVTAPRPHPLQNCDHCDRAYRAPEPGTCQGCTAAAPAAVVAHQQAA